MNAMGHDIPNVIGVDQGELESKIRELLPGYMAMGQDGMHEHALHADHHEGPPNTLPMMGGDGPFGTVAMGGMFTILKVRDNLTSYDVDPGWYDNPPGTVSGPVDPPDVPSSVEPSAGASVHTCPMHPEVLQDKPGHCPKCGMNLKPKK